MNFRQKLVYTLFGALLALVGMLFSSIVAPPVTARMGTEIVCTLLTVVDEAGNPVILLFADENGGRQAFVDKAAKPLIALGATENGPIVRVLSNTHEGKVTLTTDEQGGFVTVQDRTGNTVGGLP